MKKGFTLTELLAVIVILAIIATLSFRSIVKVRDDALKKTLQTKVKSIEKQATIYAQDNQNIFLSSNDNVIRNCNTDDYKVITDSLGYCNALCSKNVTTLNAKEQENYNKNCIYNVSNTKFCVVIKIQTLVDTNYFETGDTKDDKVTKDVKDDVTKESMLNEEIAVYRKNNRIYSKMLNSEYDFKDCIESVD